MSLLRVETRVIPAADLGPANPFPQLALNADLHAGVSSEEKSFGRVNGCLPYTIQDGYNREKKARAFKTVVLENEILRAVFFVEIGGRLWSLVHKPSGRELLHANPVFQPANLAIRNAWVSGGVEWNCGIIGHSPFTCSPLFAARAKLDDSTPVLRMWEWERIRQAIFQIDAFLPDGSPILFIRVRILNTLDRDIAMYWWSNIAVDEKPGVRVIVPADSAVHFGYTEGIKDTPIPIHNGKDISYPVNLENAQDFFYNIPPENRKYITALDANGTGLVQTSTDRLYGRKLFVWGQGTGGRHWQEFLAQPGCAYIEIQAGLARTQMDYIRMPPRADWSWLEAYGYLEADPRVVHGTNWHAARREVELRLDQLISRAKLDQLHKQTANMAVQAPLEILHQGSGWGALEQRRRIRNGDYPLCGPSVIFTEDSMGVEQEPWLKLLENGSLPESSVNRAPGSFMVQSEWRDLLEKAVFSGKSRHWLAWWHLGVMWYHAGNKEKAIQAFNESMAAMPSVWALRNLALLAKLDGKNTEASDLYIRACRMTPDLAALAVEAGQFLLETGQPEKWLDLLKELPYTVQTVPRITLMRARAHLEVGELEEVEKILSQPLVVADNREGEILLSDLWFGLHEKKLSARENKPVDDEMRERVRREFPPPVHLDFRMK